MSVSPETLNDLIAHLTGDTPVVAPVAPSALLNHPEVVASMQQARRAADLLTTMLGAEVTTTTKYRVLVTGSRTWDNADLIHRVLDELREQHGPSLVIVHGACPKGADKIADDWCRDRGVEVERFPADWNAHGKTAGPKRNQVMVDTRPDEVVAFNRDNSKGTSGCVASARMAGLNVRPPYEYETAVTPATTACANPYCEDAACFGCDRTEPAPAMSVAPMGPPPSTIGELRGVLIAYDASRPRSMQVRLGPSELGTPCQQQIARKLAGAPRRPVTDPTWAPFQGTAVHAEMEKVVAFWNAQLGRERWLAEDDLEVDPGLPGVEGIRGHGDAYDLDHQMVVDWKHVGTTALTKLRTAKRMGKPPAAQVSAEYRVQAHLYGLGHARKGRPVRHVRLVLLARSWQYDDSDEWTEPYDEVIAYEAIMRYYATHDLLAALDVAANPDFIAGAPATPSGDTCKWCPFHRPGQPTDWAGCAGDTAAHDRRVERFTDGLIAP